MSEFQPEQNPESNVDVNREFIEQDLIETQRSLKQWQTWGSAVVLGITVWLLSIGGGFASNLQPETAAKITKGLMVQRIDEMQPQISDYLRQEIPAVIEQAPEYALAQLPEYRTQIEDHLEAKFDEFAGETSSQLDETFTTFLKANEEELKTIILVGQDKEATDEVARELRSAVVAYLSSPQGNESKSIQEKLDEAMKALSEIERRTHRLAHASDLDATEKKTRRAIACLFTTVHENKDAWNLPSQSQIQGQVQQVLNQAEELAPKE
jgi:hypothetical protein